MGKSVDKRNYRAGSAVGLVRTMLATPALAESCRNTGSFDRWLAAFKHEAIAQGISQRSLAAAQPYMVYDRRIVGIDRGKRVFNQSFVQFAGRLIPAYRLQTGRQL